HPLVSSDSDFRECIACSCFAARRTARLVTQHYERHLKPSGLRATQFTVLVMLSLAGAPSLSDLSDRLGGARTALTRNLRALISRGWVRESSGQDRRVRLLAITGSGTAAARAALPLWREAQESIASRLGPAVIRALTAAAAAVAKSSPGRF